MYGGRVALNHLLGWTALRNRARRISRSSTSPPRAGAREAGDPDLRSRDPRVLQAQDDRMYGGRVALNHLLGWTALRN
ncbi:hypothetical protein CTI14_64145, partial [Methylobacterium radiotolerans]